MTDTTHDDLVKRLRSKIIVHTDVAVWILEAADRIEELEAALPEQIEWVKRLADDLIAAEGREARLKDKLAKAVERLEHVATFGDRAMWALATDTLAELKGGTDET